MQYLSNSTQYKRPHTYMDHQDDHTNTEYIQMYAHTHADTSTRAHTCTHVHTGTHMHAHTTHNTCTHTHTYPHTYIYTHRTHMHTTHNTLVLYHLYTSSFVPMYCNSWLPSWCAPVACQLKARYQLQVCNPQPTHSTIQTTHVFSGWLFLVSHLLHTNPCITCAGQAVLDAVQDPLLFSKIFKNSV